MAVWKIASFLDEYRERFGHDKKLLSQTDQSALRADDLPYLKHRQVEAGIALFRDYDASKSALVAPAPAKRRKSALNAVNPA